MTDINENSLAEQPVIEWLKEMGYEYAFGPDIGPGGAFQERSDWHQVVLEGRLRRALTRINPDIPDSLLDRVTDYVMKFDHVDLELGNKEFFESLVRGVKVDVRDNLGDWRGKMVKLIDFKHLENNEFLVVNQFSIQGKSVRIPDVIIFINGIPVVLFELKSPVREKATIVDAFSQIHDTYKEEIPKVFLYNQILIVSDLWKARHGTISTTWDFFSPWKGIDNENEPNRDLSELELLVKGICPRGRLLDIFQHFIVFEADAEKDASKYTKKMAMYHQYFGVNRAIEKTLSAVKGDKRIGVFWHTQGSGKSLSMVFYVNKLRTLEELAGPTVLFLTDRNDLDDQLYKTFLRTGYPTAKQAKSILGLEDTLKGAGAELLFTTIQKFDQSEPLNERQNIIVIADEAHRSQYADLAGNVRDVLPNASFMGITGTPIELHNRNTRIVFGEHISQYPIDRSVHDGTTVPIYYEARLVPLHLLSDELNEDYEQITFDQPLEVKLMLQRKWATLEQAVGAKDRLEQIAKDILYHFTNRGLEGKGIIVTMSREIAVKMYELISMTPYAPEIAVVISDNQAFKDRIQKELNNKELEKRFKKADDPLRLVIVCDMWLTGFDVPSLHTMYLDKPLKGHGLMQAIARVNRRYKDKEGGLIVDYIGVADNLKRSLAIYTSDIQQQAMIPIEEIVRQMMDAYQRVKAFFDGIEYRDWKTLSSDNQATLLAKTVNTLLTDQVSGNLDAKKKNAYLEEAYRLYKLFCLVMPHKQARLVKDEVEFFETVRRSIIKSTMVDPIYINKKTETAIKNLITSNIKAEGVIDIFQQAGKQSPNISILDESFLNEVKKSHLKNLTLESLRKLIEDDLRLREKSNLLRYRSLLEMLEKIIEDYENNIINSSKVIESLIALAREIREAARAGENLGLTSEEMAFYDALAQGKRFIQKEKELKSLIHELVKEIKRDIAIDWTNHDVIKARIRTNVRLILLHHNISFEEVEKLTDKIYEQAFYLYKDYQPTN